MLRTWIPDMNTPLFVVLKTCVSFRFCWNDSIWFSKLPCSFSPWRSNLIENSFIDDLFSYNWSIRYRWLDSEWTFRWLEKASCKTKKEHFGDIQYVFPNQETTPAQFEGWSAFEYDMDDTFQKFRLEKSFSLVWKWLRKLAKSFIFILRTSKLFETFEKFSATLSEEFWRCCCFGTIKFSVDSCRPNWTLYRIQ
jgi:hypothetical protein